MVRTFFLKRRCLFLYLYICELFFVKSVEYMCQTQQKYIPLYENYADNNTEKMSTDISSIFTSCQFLAILRQILSNTFTSEHFQVYLPHPTKLPSPATPTPPTKAGSSNSKVFSKMEIFFPENYYDYVFY